MNKRELSKVFSRLAKEEVNLGTHRVELGEIQNEIKKVVGSIKEMEKVFNISKKEIKESYDKYDLSRKEMEESKEKLKKAKSKATAEIDVLGIRSNRSFVKDLEKKIKKMVSDLGVKPKDVKGYSDLIKEGSYNETLIKNLKDVIKKYNV